MTSRPLLLAFLVPVAACSAEMMAEPAADEGSIDRVQLQILGGQEYKDCSPDEAAKVAAALAELVTLSTDPAQFEAFASCMARAGLIENRCTTGRAIAEHLRRNDVIKVRCKDLRPVNALAQAYVGIDGEELDIDQTYLRDTAPRVVAGTIAHELMHNRGFQHARHDYPASSLYWNTVPVQASACVANGVPYPWGGYAGPHATPPVSQTECDVCGDGPRTCCDRDSSGHCRRCAVPGQRCDSCKTGQVCCEKRADGSCVQCARSATQCR